MNGFLLTMQESGLFLSIKEKDMTDIQAYSATKKLDDPDIRLAERALKRAALKARERARRFGHGIIIYENGKIVEKLPDKNDWNKRPKPLWPQINQYWSSIKMARPSGTGIDILIDPWRSLFVTHLLPVFSR